MHSENILIPTMKPQNWQVNILTFFPELFPGPLNLSVVGRSLAKDLWRLKVKNIRDYAFNKHMTIDDTPYGGGDGMVLRADVMANAIRDVFDPNNPIIYLSPRGELFNQNMARDMISMHKGINIICGRFEGIDERVLEKFNVKEISIGDYVLSSGDIAAYVLIDTCVRNIPGVLHSYDSLQEESFGASSEYRGLLEYPHYTKPQEFEGLMVPDVLLSGNHQKIREWRLGKAREKTFNTRPDLWQKYAKDL